MSVVSKMRKNHWRVVIAVAVGTMMVLTGCANLKSRKSSSAEETAQKYKGPSPVYHHFVDVLIPGELKIIDKSTLVVQTPGMTSGIMALKGRVEKNSLVTFFNTNMIKDNWKAVSMFKSPQSTILLYQKENRWCVINIAEENFNTYVEIGVAPTMNPPGSSLLKERLLME